MAKDKRYNTVKKLITAGFIKSFSEILDTVPKTVIAQDLGMHHQTFGKLIKYPEKFTFKDAFRIASLIEVEEQTIMNLIYEQYNIGIKVKRKK
jgi:plasmid maintenance system antidote protein VapI